MKTFRIIVRTNGFQAQRSTLFQPGKTEQYLYKGLSLYEARKRMEELFEREISTFLLNWGLTTMYFRQHKGEGVHSIGTSGLERYFDYDGFYYRMEEE